MISIKHWLGLLSILFLLLIISSCKGSKGGSSEYEFSINPPFTLSEGYFQDWVAGVQQGGSGTTVSIKFESVSNNVEFKDIHFRKNYVSAKPLGEDALEYMGYFLNKKKPDVIMDIDIMEEAQNIPPVLTPFDLKANEAVISYSYESKLWYFKIYNMTEKPIAIYPTSNPDIEH